MTKIITVQDGDITLQAIAGNVHVSNTDIFLDTTEGISWTDGVTSNEMLGLSAPVTYTWPAINTFTFQDTAEWTLAESAGFRFNDDGTRGYRGYFNNTVGSVILGSVYSTPYVVTDSLTPTAIMTVKDEVNDIAFNGDGTKVFIASDIGSKIEERTNIGTPFNPGAGDIETIADTYTTVAISTSSIEFSSDGLWMYYTQTSPTNGCVQAQLSTPWDMSTAGAETFIDFTDMGVNASKCLRMAPDGMKFYVCSLSTLYEYDCGTAFDVTGSAVFVQSMVFNTGTAGGGMYGFDVSPDGTTLIGASQWGNTASNNDTNRWTSAGTGIGTPGLFAVGESIFDTQIDGLTTTITSATTTVSGTLAVSSPSYLWTIAADEANGTLNIAGNDPYNNEYGIFADTGGTIYLGGGGAIEAVPGTPALGDTFSNTHEWLAGDYLSSVIAEVGYYGDDLFQFGQLVDNAPFAFYVTKPGNDFRYPFAVDAENEKTYFGGMEVRIASANTAWGGGAAGSSMMLYGPNYVEFGHDDTDFNIIGVNTTDMNFTGVAGRYIFEGNNNFDSGEIRHQAFGDVTEWIEMGHTGASIARITSSDSIYIHPNAGQVNIDRVPLRITSATLGTVHGVFSHDDTDFNLDFLTTTDYNVGSGLSGNIKAQTSISILEAAAAIADTTAYGQIWVKDDAPNRLVFTDDTGQDIQISPYRAIVQTTTAAVTEIINIAVPSDEGFGFEIHIIGTDDTNNDVVFERIFGAIYNATGTTALVGSTVTDRTDTAGASGWVVTVAADDTGDTLTVDVTGAAVTIDWKVSVQLLNV